MKALPLLAVLLIPAALAAYPDDLSPGDIFTGAVVHVRDGDTIIVESDGASIPVRLGDLDTPEMNETGGPEAKHLMQLTVGQTVSCTVCEGARHPGVCRSYNRIIAVCRLGQQRLGDIMRALGVVEGGR